MKRKARLGRVLAAGFFLLAAEAESARLRAVHSGSLTIGGGATFNTGTMPAVDMTKAFLVFGATGDDNSPDDLHISGQITNPTTVRFQRLGSTVPVTVRWYVAEFSSGVRVQRGTQQLPGVANPADTDIPIAAVDLSKSFPLISYRTNGSDFDGGDWIRAKLTSATNLRLLAPDADTSSFVEWQVVEYVDARVQSNDVVLGSGATSVASGLAPTVTTAKSWLIYTYSDVSGFPNVGRALVRGRVTNSSTVTFDRDNSGDDLTITWYLVEFTDSTLVQHDPQLFNANEFQRDVTLATAVNPGSAIASGGYFGRGGRSNYAADDNPGVGWFTLDLTSSTNLRITRGSTAGNTATADIGWFVVDFIGGGCSPLSVTESAGVINVQATADCSMNYDTAAGGGIREFFDLRENPTLDLAGSVAGTGNSESLHNIGMRVGGVHHNSGVDAGSDLELLEATATRARIRSRAGYVSNTGTRLPSVRTRGDYSVYPSGKIGLRFRQDLTVPLAYEREYVEMFVRYTSAGTLSNWSVSSENQTVSGQPGSGPDDFLLARIDAAGARTDFLNVLYRDWSTADGHTESAEVTNWVFQGSPSPERVNPGWIEQTGQSLPAGASENWDLLTYFRPTTFLNNSDPAVLERRDDYRFPDDLSITIGNPWNDPAENTASDHFNEAEAAYALTLDPALGLRFDIDGGTTTRHAPFFKIRQWRSLQGPSVTLQGAPITNFTADVKPIARAHFAQDLLWASTFQDPGSVTTPDVGSPAAVNGTTSFTTGKHGNGALFDAAGENVSFPSPGFVSTEGAFELWYQPAYAHTDGVAHRIWGYFENASSQMRFRKTVANALEFEILDGGTSTLVSISSANYSWLAFDWVHLRVEVRLFPAPLGQQVRIFINGIEPPHTDPVNNYLGLSWTGAGTLYIGSRETGAESASGVIDEFRIYSSASAPQSLAHGGLVSATDESLASGTLNSPMSFSAVDAVGRGEYLYFGSDSAFRGLNVALATNGAGIVDLQWEYWNGAQWANLESGFGFTDQTNQLTRSGTVYWTGDPGGWAEYSVNGGPDLYYVRASLASGAYTTTPVEGIVKTDILLFQYCGDITLDGRQFQFTAPVPTAVELESFEALALDGGVELRWSTGSELSNLGFHLYRSTSETGPFDPITLTPIPGLGSSPAGAAYRHLDRGLENGVAYYYLLEDIETTGRTERHGPISATPAGGAPPATGEPGITFGEPDATYATTRWISSTTVEIVLTTGGFEAQPSGDGSVSIDVPGFEELVEAGVALPVKRLSITGSPGRRARILAIEPSDLRTFSSLRPAEASSLELVATSRGSVTASRRRGRKAFESREEVPAELARIVSEDLQGREKRVLLELAPIRFLPEEGALVLARRLAVRISLAAGAERGPTGPRVSRGSAILRLSTREPGLYSYPLGPLGRLDPTRLRLRRLGRDVPWLFDPSGKVLLFWSEGGAANPYGHEAVFELEKGAGLPMAVLDAAPRGEELSWYWRTERLEENRLYQAGLVAASDPWLWDLVMSGTTKSFLFPVTDLTEHERGGNLLVHLQGTSDVDGVEDHHLFASLNDVLLGEARFDGKTAQVLSLALPPGVLREGENVLRIENVGDTGAAYSMVMLDRFEVRYPRLARGTLVGEWPSAGTARVEKISSKVRVLDLTEERPRALAGLQVDGWGTLRFAAEAGHTYAVVDSPLCPEARKAGSARLLAPKNRADYLVVGPRAFLPAMKPLLALRERQGLAAKGVAIEDVYDDFGFGETRPEALRDFLRFAYHEWKPPAFRYVLLVGDGTYDFKDYLGTGKANQVPPWMVRTSYLWTAADPLYAAVNGDDSLPDVAIGRLPAASLDELDSIVEKILAYERGIANRGESIVLVTDEPDEAGDFVENAESLARGTLSGRAVRILHARELGSGAMREAIRGAFDDGASLLSYIGHGGIHLWASENFWNNADVPALAAQPRQPLVLTLNCLNGYFHFPYFDSLGESLLKAEGKGAIASFAPSGLGLDAPAHLLHQALLDALLHGGHERLGDAVLEAQRVYAGTGAFPELLSIYHLLGDPALILEH